MKKLLIPGVLFGGAVALVCAQNYSVDWRTVAGGGGVSTGGVYSVSGTVGQPDAAESAGGPYFVSGGFWSVFAVQLPGAPLLSIRPSESGAVILSWPAAFTNFQLQASSDLTSTIWSNVPNMPADDGTNRTVLIVPSTGRTFFRLKK